MLSIVVPWRDRHELRETLPALVASAAALGGDVTVVNLGGDQAVLNAQTAALEERVDVVNLPGPAYFNKALAQNIGALVTRQPLLFFCDCDVIVDPEEVRRISEHVARTPDTFGTFESVRESNPTQRPRHVLGIEYRLRIATRDGRVIDLTDRDHGDREGTRPAPGLLIVQRDAFTTVEGFNSKLRGWGWDEHDMIARLVLGAGLERHQDGTAVHLSHTDADRTRAYPDDDLWSNRMRMMREAIRRYDGGNFLGTCSLDARQLRADDPDSELLSAPA
jgi:hypothetical protein